MACGERDKVDTSLILPTSRKSLPSKCVQGLDYPQAVSTTVSKNPKSQKHLSISTSRLKDSSKLDGEACNEDGTLKEASELEWPDSPSSSPSATLKQVYDENDNGDGTEHNRSKRRRDDDKSDVSDSDTVQPKRQQRRLVHKRDSNASDDEQATRVNDEDQAEIEEEADEPDESESEEDEGTKRYNEATAKQGKSKATKKSHQTRDLHLCFSKDVCTMANGEKRAGEYCTFCLADKVPKSKAFLTGNVSARRTHISRCHYKEYLAICAEKGIAPKATPPKGWEDKSQKDITAFTVKVTKLTPVTKAGLKEFLLEMIIDTDLSFRFVERRSVHRTFRYLCPKLANTDIPKKTCMADAIMKKMEKLDEIDKGILRNIPSRISVIWDGWSTKRRRQYSSFSIQYIDSPPDNPNLWSLKSHLLTFDHTCGRHTGKMTGQGLVDVIKKFGFEDKLGWMVGDNVSVNNVAISYVCKMLDLTMCRLDPKEVRGRCIEHTIHLMACHFTRALNIPALNKTKRRLQHKSINDTEDEEENEYDEDLDVEVSMDIEATEDDVEAILAASITDFEAGDVVGKLMAFIAQIRLCSKDTQDYLMDLCATNGCARLEIKLWVRTRWGSLSDCFAITLSIQKAIDCFCALADDNPLIPPLAWGKKWSDYKLTRPEWQIIKLAYDCLKILASAHGDLSVEKSPTCNKVFPLLEKLQSFWEQLSENPEFEPVKHALDAGLKNMKKWYRKTDNTSIYFICHVLDPARKLSYLEVAWEDEWVAKAMACIKIIFLSYKAQYDASQAQGETTTTGAQTIDSLNRTSSAADDWMDAMIKRNKPKASTANQWIEEKNPFDELD